MKPTIETRKGIIKILFWKQSILIDGENDKLYVNGNPLITTQTTKLYDLRHTKSGNDLRPKKRIKTLNVDKYMVVIDVSWDGRLFFLLFTKPAYKSLRASPCWSASYWNNRHTKQKEFYAEGLSVPKYLYDSIENRWKLNQEVF